MGDNTKKLKIKTTGAGDPTFILTLNIPSTDQNTSGSNNLAIGIHAWVGTANYPALNYTGTFTTDQDITILSSFPAPDQAVYPLPARLTFAADQGVELSIENTTTYPTTRSENINGIDFENIELFPAQSHTTETLNQASCIFHLQGTTSNNVFLVQEGNSVDVESVMISNNRGFEWTLVPIDTNNSTFAIYSSSYNKYLIPSSSSSNQLDWTSDLPTDPNSFWTFHKRPDTDRECDVYQIMTADGMHYLHSDGSTVGISGQLCEWYLHLNRIDFV